MKNIIRFALLQPLKALVIMVAIITFLFAPGGVAINLAGIIFCTGYAFINRKRKRMLYAFLFTSLIFLSGMSSWANNLFKLSLIIGAFYFAKRHDDDDDGDADFMDVPETPEGTEEVPFF